MNRSSNLNSSYQVGSSIWNGVKPSLQVVRGNCDHIWLTIVHFEDTIPGQVWWGLVTTVHQADWTDQKNEVTRLKDARKQSSTPFQGLSSSLLLFW